MEVPRQGARKLGSQLMAEERSWEYSHSEVQLFVYREELATWEGLTTSWPLSLEQLACKVGSDTCTPMFTAALFTIAKTWKQPNYPSTDEWIKKMWYIYTMQYYSAIKRKEIMPFAETWVDLEIIILSEVSQRKTNIIWYHIYVESKKKLYKWTYIKNRNKIGRASCRERV